MNQVVGPTIVTPRSAINSLGSQASSLGCPGFVDKSIRSNGLPEAAGGPKDQLQYVSQGLLLGQRRGGELLSNLNMNKS